MAGINREGESLAEDNGRGGGRQSVVQEVDQNADKSARCTRASGQSGHVSLDREEGQMAFDLLAVSVTMRNVTNSRVSQRLRYAHDVSSICKSLKHEQSDGTRAQICFNKSQHHLNKYIFCQLNASLRVNMLGSLAARRHRFDMYVASSSRPPRQQLIRTVVLFTASSGCLRLLPSISSPPPSPLSRCNQT